VTAAIDEPCPRTGSSAEMPSGSARVEILRVYVPPLSAPSGGGGQEDVTRCRSQMAVEHAGVRMCRERPAPDFHPGRDHVRRIRLFLAVELEL